MIEVIKDFEHLEKYTKLVEKKLFTDLWDMIYKPLFKILKIKAVNDKDVIIEALKRGDIYFQNDGFKAAKKFSNNISRALMMLGARYDRWQKKYIISFDELPDYIAQEIIEDIQRAAKQLAEINSFLQYVEMNLDQIVETMIFNKEVDTILGDVEGQLHHNTRNINVIVPELTDEQKQTISENYTNNMQYYIKNWAVKRIPEMRLKVQEAILNGYREEQVQKMLEKEYHIMSDKAKFLAQNETSIMIAELKKATYTQMGFEEFIWNTILDSRERPEHRKLHGKICRFDNPPVIDERTGQRGLPGQTYNCRCGLTPIRRDSVFFNQKEINQYKNLKNYAEIMNEPL